jgi:hypothetical protein
MIVSPPMQEYDTDQDVDIAMIVALHKSKRPSLSIMRGCGGRGLMGTTG